MQIGSSHAVQSDLNVTPMIDVVLVLLIIFMVVTPLSEKKLPVVVPEEAPVDAPAPPPGQEPLVLAVDAQGRFTLMGDTVDDPDLVRTRLRDALATRSPKVVFLEAVDEAPYARAILAMDTARQAGAAHVGIIDPAPPPAASSGSTPGSSPEPTP
jgi:biopolymer transport protein ExbD